MTSEQQKTSAMQGEHDNSPSFELVAKVVRLLESLDTEAQSHVLQTVTTWLHLDSHSTRAHGPQRVLASSATADAPPGEYPFSGRAEVNAKEFMLEKEPITDLERLTCLAYYLTHYRSQPYFKTEDLSKLNMDAAQPKFSNAAYTAKNAMRDGYFVQAPKKGLRQLSALGEQYVQALPDHVAARAVRKRMGNRGRRIRVKDTPASET